MYAVLSMADSHISSLFEIDGLYFMAYVTYISGIRNEINKLFKCEPLFEPHSVDQTIETNTEVVSELIRMTCLNGEITFVLHSDGSLGPWRECRHPGGSVYFCRETPVSSFFIICCNSFTCSRKPLPVRICHAPIR